MHTSGRLVTNRRCVNLRILVSLNSASKYNINGLDFQMMVIAFHVLERLLFYTLLSHQVPTHDRLVGSQHVDVKDQGLYLLCSHSQLYFIFFYILNAISLTDTI